MGSDHFVFSPAPLTAWPIEGEDRFFPVRRVYCVGRNYADHAREMGHDPDREPPFFFQKNPQNLTFDGRFAYPVATGDVHHEVELAVALSKGGEAIAAENALDCVFGYAVALDMTRRDRQAEAKKASRPWEIAKAFEGSAPAAALVPASRIGHPGNGAITLDVNGARRQEGDLNQMIWPVADVIACLSGLFTLAPGDVILTGTPAGVGAVERGDRLEAAIEGVGRLSVSVV
ncbi:MAG: fumarylacetoacetate hydrolase family protein [Hyphomicrobiaceae bacterium]|nr:fumarylacetoacetate hydrolase family protein [Hyphomicrobiaceae bacterium]